MGYYSSIGIAIISTEKAKLDKLKQDFMQSSSYQQKPEWANFFLELFEEKTYRHYHLLVVNKQSIKWYSDMEAVWNDFSDICNTLKINWCFIRAGEESGDVEFSDNLDLFNEKDITLELADIFGLVHEVHCYI